MNRNFAGNVGTGGTPFPGVDPLLTDREAAAQLGCSRSTLWRWVGEGIVPKPLKLGGLSRWRHSEIEAVILRADAERDVI